MSDTLDRLRAALEGRYRVERELGEGGMATVYLARDLKHNRNVALKVLRAELAAVVGAERFLTEIETTANLQHPHILPLFDSGEADGFLYYVMPYVEGETLRDRLDRERQLPVDEAIRIATAVANALQTAHEAGIVHRDIKPANILMSRGEPLVADFGIALAVGGASGARLTETGLSIGTPYYMSPEQATGDQVIGPASDIFALGSVLFEMLVGEPPYPGSTAQAVLGKIIQGAPVSATAVRRSVPAHVDAAIRKALERLPADRFSGSGDFAKALADRSFRHGEDPAVTGAARSIWKHAAYGFAATSVALAGLAAWALTRPTPPAPGIRASIVLSEPLGGFASFDISSDGTLLVYEGPVAGGDESAGSQLWMRRLDELHASPIAGTEGAIGPSISPDGRDVAFALNTGGGGPLLAVSLAGGVPRQIAASAYYTGSWSRDGFVYFTEGTTRRIARVPDAGGEVQILTGPPDAERPEQQTNPFAIEGSDLVLFDAQSDLGTIEIHALDLRSGTVTERIARGSKPLYAASGHLLYVTTARDLVAVPFDPGTGALQQVSPVPLATGVSTRTAGPLQVAISDNGTLVYGMGLGSSSFEAVWVGRDGSSAPIHPGWTFDPGINNRGLALSPDGTRLALTIFGEAAEDIWIKELPQGPLTRLTSDAAQDVRPRWTADGRVTFLSERGDLVAKVYVRRADGTGSDELLLESEEDIWEAEMSSDGAWLVARTGGFIAATGGRDVIALRLEEGAEPTPLIVTPFDEKAIALSPDDRWIAYEAGDAGHDEIYVRPFPGADAGRFTVSVAGGVMPVWSPDGHAIFYVTPDREMVEARVRTEPSFAVTDRQVLFRIGPEYLIPRDEQYALYDVTPDGERFVMMRRTGTDEGELILVTNLHQELEVRLPR